MSTFSGLNTAYTGLSAARRGLDVVGQNIANVNTPGYTRQRVTTSAMGGASITGRFSTGPRPGEGVSVDGIARLGSLQLDARVRATAATSGFSAVRANALAGLETSLNEPGKNGISTSLPEFWAAWQGVSKAPGDEAAATSLIGQATIVAGQIATGYKAVEEQWTGAYKQLKDMEAELNGAASQIASLNAQIRSTLASGGSANELIDQRNALTTTVAALAGGTVRETEHGMVDVLIDGNAIVSGDIVRPVQVAGGIAMGSEAPRLEWSHRPGANMAVSGEIAGVLSLLAPASDGGTLASAAEGYNNFAKALAGAVNGVHNGGVNTAGTVMGDFFSHGTDPAALSLKVLATKAADIATGAPGQGSKDNSIADAIAQLGSGPGSPDSVWASFVSNIGANTRVEMKQADLAGIAAAAAVGMQLSNSSVDLDEENLNLLAYQHAYQGAARVMTAIDEMLDTLINRTGIVGR